MKRHTLLVLLLTTSAFCGTSLGDDSSSSSSSSSGSSNDDDDGSSRHYHKHKGSGSWMTTTSDKDHGGHAWSAGRTKNGKRVRPFLKTRSKHSAWKHKRHGEYDTSRSKLESEQGHEGGVGTEQPDAAAPDFKVDLMDVGNPTTNRCADLDLTVFELGRLCGSPLSTPCFDHSRCPPQTDGKGPTFYVYDNDCSLKNSSELAMLKETENNRMLSPIWRDAANEMGVLAESYESACMFIHVNNQMRQEPCAVNAPLWNHGANHFMVDVTDSGRDSRPSVANSLAMEGASNIRTCFYRSEYDISLPLSPEKVFSELANIPATARKYFLTVKGSVYLGGRGSEERMALVPINNEAEGVITSLRCFEKHDEHLLPENTGYCQALMERYYHHGFEDLMNTTFGLVPGGRSPGTYRLAEVMSAGAIPVFVARDIVRPFREQLDWPSFSFMFTPDQARTAMVRTLKAVPQERLLEMQRKSLEAYHSLFGDTQAHTYSEGYDYISRRVLSLLMDRIAYH